MAIELKVPAVGESVTEVYLGAWRKREGDPVRKGEPLIEIETDKATVDLPSPVSGVLEQVLKGQGETAAVGEVIARLRAEGEGAGPDPQEPAAGPAPGTGEAADPEARGRGPGAPPPPQVPPAAPAEPRIMPAARRALAERGVPAATVRPTGPGGRVLKEDVLRQGAAQGPAGPPPPRTPSPPGPGGEPEPAPEPGPQAPPAGVPTRGRREEIVPLSPVRRRIAQRLVAAQQNAALLTTFNEIDMTRVIALREAYREAFLAKHGVRLGVVSFFVKATVDALKLVPQLNAEIRGADLVRKDYYDIGIAVGGGRGLVVPVLRDADRLGFPQIERAVKDFARRAQEGTLRVEELRGGTFTISNGGIYGSLLSTPIVNPPQSGVLGLHRIEERPVARGGQVVIRPMMYVALTYDHRIVDGREAVTFLRRVKEGIEEPARLLLEV